jgi:hypothetical protein
VTGGYFVTISLGLCGIDLILAGYQIVWKKKILDPAKYIQLFFIRSTGDLERAENYEKSLKIGKNWPRYGKSVIVVGFFCVLFAFYVWSLMQ